MSDSLMQLCADRNFESKLNDKALLLRCVRSLLSSTMNNVHSARAEVHAREIADSSTPTRPQHPYSPHLTLPSTPPYSSSPIPIAPRRAEIRLDMPCPHTTVRIPRCSHDRASAILGPRYQHASSSHCSHNEVILVRSRSPNHPIEGPLFASTRAGAQGC